MLTHRPPARRKIAVPRRAARVRTRLDAAHLTLDRPDRRIAQRPPRAPQPTVADCALLLAWRRAHARVFGAVVSRAIPSPAPHMPPAVPAPRDDAQSDGTLGALALWNAEIRAGRRTVGQRDALARAATFDAAARDATRSARACEARADCATTTSDRVRFAACAATDRRDAAEYRRRAALALLTDDAERDASVRGRSA